MLPACSEPRQTSDDTCTKDHKAEMSPIDFFDLLTQHRSPTFCEPTNWTEPAVPSSLGSAHQSDQNQSHFQNVPSSNQAESEVVSNHASNELTSKSDAYSFSNDTCGGMTVYNTPKQVSRTHLISIIPLLWHQNETVL